MHSHKKICLLLLSCFLWVSFFNLYSQNKVEQPKLVVGITVDQMRYDYLNRFSEKFGEGGFKRLINDGFSCENNYLNYIPTKTAPGHASIYTGTTPRTHGILGNYWFDVEKDKLVDCVYDPSVGPVGTGSKGESSSPRYLTASTLTDAFKDQKENESKTISIALKARSAVLSGGKKADAAYWFRGNDQGHWITSSYYRTDLPAWVKRFNESDALESYMTQWEPLLPIADYTESDEDDRAVERGFRGKAHPDFPYNLKELAQNNQGYNLLEFTPFGNSYALNFATAVLQGEQLGKNSATDFLLISLSSTDAIGHNFGVNSKEVEDTYLRLDRDLAAFLTELDTQVGKGNYTLFLTSDHGASPNAHALNAKNISGGYFKEATFKIEVKDHVFKKYGTTEIIKNISNNQVFLDKKLIADSNLDISEIEKSIQQFIIGHPQIATVLTRSQLEKGAISGAIETYLFNGFNTARSGDIFYALKEHVLVYSETGSDHGSGYEYDIHTPLLFYGFGIKKGSTNKNTLTIDIVATLSKLLDIAPPKDASKNTIDVLLKKN